MRVVACGLVVQKRGRGGSPQGGGREACSQGEGGMLGEERNRSITVYYLGYAVPARVCAHVRAHSFGDIFKNVSSNVMLLSGAKPQ